MSERVEHWIRVPDKSTLKISVTGTSADNSLMATIDGLDNDNQQFVKSLNTATGRPFELTIKKTKRYSIDILLNWQTTAKASVRAHIETTSGARFGEPYSIDIDGKAGQEEFVSLFLFAVKQ